MDEIVESFIDPCGYVRYVVVQRAGYYPVTVPGYYEMRPQPPVVQRSDSVPPKPEALNQRVQNPPQQKEALNPRVQNPPQQPIPQGLPSESGRSSQAVEKAGPEPAGIVNRTCPIMGGDVDPELTADYKGKKVGFCCKGCPPKWNALSDSERAAKLAQQLPPR